MTVTKASKRPASGRICGCPGAKDGHVISSIRPIDDAAAIRINASHNVTPSLEREVFHACREFNMTDEKRKCSLPALGGKRVTMAEVLRNRFPLFLNEKTLRSAIEAVCSDFGKVKHLTILPAMQGSALHCACSLRLDSAAAEAALRARLEILEKNGELHFMADVDNRWTGRTM